MGVALLVLSLVLGESEPFATVWFNMSHDVTKVTFDEGSARWDVGAIMAGGAD